MFVRLLAFRVEAHAAVRNDSGHDHVIHKVAGEVAGRQDDLLVRAVAHKNRHQRVAVTSSSPVMSLVLWLWTMDPSQKHHGTKLAHLRLDVGLHASGAHRAVHPSGIGEPYTCGSFRIDLTLCQWP